MVNFLKQDSNENYNMNYWTEILSFANVIISLFVVAFAIVFLKKTEPINGRKPWVYLFMAVVIFLLFQIFKVIGLFSAGAWPELADFLQTLFIGLVLYVFIYQYHLLYKSGVIVVKSKPKFKKKVNKKKSVSKKGKK